MRELVSKGWALVPVGQGGGATVVPASEDHVLVEALGLWAGAQVARIGHVLSTLGPSSCRCEAYVCELLPLLVTLRRRLTHLVETDEGSVEAIVRDFRHAHLNLGTVTRSPATTPFFDTIEDAMIEFESRLVGGCE